VLILSYVLRGYGKMTQGPEKTKVPRRLAAILAADISGYSALMSADEADTVRNLKEHQAVVLPMIKEHGGRIIDTAGDGIPGGVWQRRERSRVCGGNPANDGGAQC